MNWIKTNEQPLSKKHISGEIIRVEMCKQVNNGPPIFKGTTIIKSSLARIAFVLTDIDSKKKWVNRLAAHSLIEGDIIGKEYTTFEHYNLAWPISDREYVLDAKWSLDLEIKEPTATLKITSTTHPKHPLREDRVRGELQKLVFRLKEIQPGITETIVEIKVDPKGKLPGFLANLIQKNWPVTTLRALNKEVLSGKDLHVLFT